MHDPLEVAGLDLLRLQQLIHEALVLFPAQGTVQVVVTIPLAVTGGSIDPSHVKGVGGDDGGDGVVEVEPVAGQPGE